MSETVLEHPLVRQYLRALDSACVTLPAERARELREQIAAHLDEALPPGAADEEVRAELQRLGAPKALAAEAAGPRPAARRLLTRLSRLPWWAWTAVAAVVAVAATVTTYVIGVETAAPLVFNTTFSWWSPIDAARSVQTYAGGSSQDTVPIRSGQQQGYVVYLENDSDWTQVILGPGPGGFDGIGAWGGVPVQIGVGDSREIEEGGGDFRAVRYVLPGAIPPHSIRAVRVLWISNTCLQDPGGSQGSDLLTLQVRVGLFTRTETVTLPATFALSGPSAASDCAGNG
jgi:hypothetical protein